MKNFANNFKWNFVSTVGSITDLGHRSYEPGTLTYNKVVSEFGRDIVGENGEINRRQLASRVFSNEVHTYVMLLYDVEKDNFINCFNNCNLHTSNVKQADVVIYFMFA